MKQSGAEPDCFIMYRFLQFHTIFLFLLQKNKNYDRVFLRKKFACIDCSSMTAGEGRIMKEKIQKIVQNQKVGLIICVMAIFLSVMCFVSSNTAPPAESEQPAESTDLAQTAGTAGSGQKTENSGPAQADQSDPDMENSKGADSSETGDSSQQAESGEAADSAGTENSVPDTENSQAADSAETGSLSQNIENGGSEPPQTHDPEGFSAVFDLDEAVGQAVLSHYREQYMGLECPAEGHEILGSEEQDGYVMVYALTMYGEYRFADDRLVKGAGSGVMPAVMKFSFDEKRGYVLEDYQKSEDENDRLQWIQTMFPGPLWKSCSPIREEAAEALAKQERSYAKQYLRRIGREAPIDSDSASDRRVLTDAGISVEVSNKLCEMDEQLENYPYWIGSQEELEGGVRYVYELALAKESEQIVYTKTEYDTDEIVEQFRFDMHTGEEIRS